MTEYRLFQIEKDSSMIFIQFKSTEVKKKVKWLFWIEETVEEVWKFIPKEDRPVFFGEYLTQAECPSGEINFHDQLDFIQTSYDYPSWLTKFANKYPDVQAYFDELNVKRKERLEYKKKASEFKTQYLT